MIQKILSATVLLGTVGYIYAEEKKKSTLEHLDFIKFTPVGIRNIDAKLNDFEPQLRFNIDLKIENKKSTDFTVNGLIVKLQRIIIVDKNNKAIGVAMPNMSSIRVPAFSYTTINNVPVVIDLKNAITNILNWKSLNINSLKFVGIISVLGLEYMINN